MNYHYYFDEDINKDSVNNLVDKLQNIEGKIKLYFATDGGCCYSMNFLIKFLNSRKDDITIVLTDRCFSAGTQILVLFKGKIETEELDCVLFHLADRERYMLRKDHYITNSKILMKQDVESNKDFAKKIKKKGLLTTKQLSSFLKGKDVVVYSKQIKKWKL